MLEFTDRERNTSGMILEGRGILVPHINPAPRKRIEQDRKSVYPICFVIKHLLIESTVDYRQNDKARPTRYCAAQDRRRIVSGILWQLAPLPLPHSPLPLVLPGSGRPSGSLNCQLPRPGRAAPPLRCTLTFKTDLQYLRRCTNIKIKMTNT